MTTLKQNILTIFLILTICIFKVVGQSSADNVISNESICEMKFDSTLNRSYYIYVDKMPIYRGGQDTLRELINRNLRLTSGECCINGTVYLSFIIEPNGMVTNKKVYKSFLSDNNTCSPNKEALRVMDYLIDWTAGQCNGKNVAVLFILPIKFGSN